MRADPVLTLERLERVHEVQVGLQGNQSRLDHVCVPQVRCKSRKGDRAVTLPSQICSHTCKA